MKKIIMFCISVLILFPLFACEKDMSEGTSKQYVINSDGIMSVGFSAHSDGKLHEVLNDDINTIIAILNSAQYDNESNDGKMFKMEAASFEIEIQYIDDEEVNVKLWDNIMYVNQTWYKLDIKNIKEIFSKYNENNQ